MNQDNHLWFANRAMNTALWTAQVLFGLFWSVSGFGKIFWYNSVLWNQALHQVPWLSGVPQNLIILIGVCEFLGGVGLILPAMTGVRPRLTPYAAFGLTLIMILAAAFHIVRGEYGFLTLNLVLGAATAFIAYGRLSVRPVAPASISTLRALTAVFVLGTLVFVGYAPVWYRLTHIR